MKKSYILIIVVILLLVGSLSAFSIPPAPGVNMLEPRRPRIPFEVEQVSANGVTKRSLVDKQYGPAINLAPRGLLILAEFTDVAFAENNTHQAFDSLANSDNYTYNGATGSCQAYFTDQSNGQYNPVFDVIGPVILPHEVAYYGSDKPNASGDDQYIADFVVDACKAADSLGVDFTQYDNNGDGIVDFVYIIYAGVGQADGGAATTIWPHNWDLMSALYFNNTNQTKYYAYYDDNDSLCYNLPELDGKALYSYACSNELRYATKARSGIGTICHEFSHVLGLPDYYITDTRYSHLEKFTPGAWSLMGYGNYLNNGNTPPNYSIYDKYYLGWVEPKVLNTIGEYQLLADGESGYLLARNEVHVENGAYRTDTVYYLENRQQTGWDEYLPGHGMLVWRVMYDAEKWANNMPNDFKTRYRLVCADASADPYTLHESRPDVPFPGSTNQQNFAPFNINALDSIQESTDGVISFVFTTENKTPVENILVPPYLQGLWYNLLGQRIDPAQYKGIAIHNKQKYLLR